MNKPKIALLLGTGLMCWMPASMKADEANRNAADKGSEIVGLFSPDDPPAQPRPAARASKGPQAANPWQFELAGLVALGALGLLPRPSGKKTATR